MTGCICVRLNCLSMLVITSQSCPYLSVLVFCMLSSLHASIVLLSISALACGCVIVYLLVSALARESFRPLVCICVLFMVEGV